VNIELSEYIDARGHNHYREWASKMDPSVRARIDKSVLRMESGNLAGVKPEGEGVSALRIDFGPGYRVYFGQDGEKLLILLAGGTKRRQEDDIQMARSLWAEYKKRKRENQRETANAAHKKL
jgi:putative addiction module killer protein